MCIAQRTPATDMKAVVAKDLKVSAAASSDKVTSKASTSNGKQKHHGQQHRHHHPRLIVHHNYTDYANVPPPAVDHYAALARSGANTAFPLKLYDMLERVEVDGYADIVSWQPHGRCFVVHKPEQFKDLLPRYFKLSKIASFQRQLNLYGFTRLSSGADRNGYYHERFLRGKPFLIEYMTRAKVKGTCVRARANPLEEPDFWNMTWVNCNGVVHPRPQQKQQQQQQQQPPMPALSEAKPEPTPSQAHHLNRNSSSSVVSHEDDAQPQDTRSSAGSSDEYDPIPLSITASSSISMQKLHDDQIIVEDDRDEDDIVMTGWGMKFHYLDSIPDDIPIASCQSRQQQQQQQQQQVVTEPTPVRSSSSTVDATTNYTPMMIDEEQFMYEDFERVLNELLDGDKIELTSFS